MQFAVLTMLLIHSVGSFSQDEASRGVIVHYSDDHEVALIGTAKQQLDSPADLNTSPSSLIESLLANYRFSVEPLIEDWHHCNETRAPIYLDSSNFSKLIKNSDLTLYSVKYGYGGSQNFDDLTEKYGVIFLAGGCLVTPTDLDRSYQRLQNKLLAIRNGKNWQDACFEEMQKRRHR